MKKFKKNFAFITIAVLTVLLATVNVSSAAPQEDVDVRYLQKCLKTEGSSLDVLVLMDSSKSLRNWVPSDGKGRKNLEGSDPEGRRGPILKSSLKLLNGLAKESGREINISLRNFGGNNKPKELELLQAKWKPWSSDLSDDAIDSFVKSALFDNSAGTQYGAGLSSARDQFEERFNQVEIDKGKSCPILFWITDGAPDPGSADGICLSGNDSSIDWFRKNNILVLGGLLQPKASDEREKAKKFRTFVESGDCGGLESEWTKGSVIEAENIADLAWGFIGLIANIKNLVNLDAAGSSFNADPSTAQINIYIKDTSGNWEVRSPDGKVFCSSSRDSNRCESDKNLDTGITTITVFPNDPRQSGGKWIVTPNVPDGDLLVYGGLSTSTKPTPDTRIKLVLSSTSSSPEEGEPFAVHAELRYSDGTPFNITGFRQLDICASVASKSSPSCEPSSPIVDLKVFPISTDTSVEVEAVVTSSVDPNRRYRVSGSLPIKVSYSKDFPSLVCSSDPCKLTNLENKQKDALSTLTVEAAKSGVTGGRIYLVDYKILSDKVKNRGDGNFVFKISRSDGTSVAWNDPNQTFEPRDEVKLTVGMDVDGKSPIKGQLRYAVVTSDGDTIIREIDFTFDVKNNFSWWIIPIVLIAYIITAGIPYAYFLWSARKDAILNIPDGSFAYLALPVEISAEGKLRQIGELPANVQFFGDYKKLEKRDIEDDSRSVEFDRVKVEIFPPKRNPFNDPVTTISVPGSFVATTYGQPNLAFREAPFTPSVVDEAVLYFTADSNIDAVRTVTEEIVVDESGLDFLNDDTETVINDVTAAPDGPVSATLLLIVPAYGSRKKSLEDIQTKLHSSLGGHDYSEQIKSLREKSLKDAVTRREAEAALELQKQIEEDKKKLKKSGTKKKKPEGTPVPEVIDEEIDEWSSSSGNSNNQNSTSKSDGDDEW
jgi:hypothetical protein